MSRLGFWLARFLAPVPPLQAARITYYTTLPTSTGARNIGVRNRAPVSVRGTREQGPRPAEVGKQIPTQKGRAR